MKTPFGEIVADERVPKDEIWLVLFQPDGTVRKSTPDDPKENVFLGIPIRVHKFVNIGEPK
jgi:hypothetical protein